MAIRIDIADDQQTDIDRRYLNLRSQLLTHDGLAHITPPTPLIAGWLYQDSLAWLGGKPGEGKSFIALDMAYSVATGHNWQGHEVTQGTVLYLAAEGASGLSIRAEAWCKANGNPDILPILFLPLALALKSPEEIDTGAFSLILQDAQPNLVIIDTQARVTVGAEENSAKDMGHWIDALETLRAAVPATYLTVHHTPRNGENLRGSIALEGAAETVMLSKKEGDILTVSCTKQKNAAPPDDLQLYLQPIGESVVPSVEAAGLMNFSTPNQDQLHKLILDEYPDTWVAQTELIDRYGKGRTTYFEAKNPLVNQGKLLQKKDGRTVLIQGVPTT